MLKKTETGRNKNGWENCEGKRNVGRENGISCEDGSRLQTHGKEVCGRKECIMVGS